MKPLADGAGVGFEPPAKKAKRAEAAAEAAARAERERMAMTSDERAQQAAAVAGE